MQGLRAFLPKAELMKKLNSISELKDYVSQSPATSFRKNQFSICVYLNKLAAIGALSLLPPCPCQIKNFLLLR